MASKYPAFRPTKEVHVSFRLLMPLPQTVIFPSGPVMVWLQSKSYPPYARLLVGDREWSGLARFDSVESAERYAAGVLDFEAPSQSETVFRQLVKVGRAELLRDRHSQLYYMSSHLREVAARRARELWG